MNFICCFLNYIPVIDILRLINRLRKTTAGTIENVPALDLFNLFFYIPRFYFDHITKGIFIPKMNKVILLYRLLIMFEVERLHN
jgi:hypothetical protein